MGKSKDLFEVGLNVQTDVVHSLNTTKEALSKSREQLKEWMLNHSQLPEILDDRSLENFLILNKCDVVQTKKKIYHYYSVRSQLSDIFNSINPKLSFTKNLMETLYMVPLPKLTKEMYRVLVIKVRRKDLVDRFDLYDGVRHIINISELRLKEDVMYQDVLILDEKSITLKFMFKATPALMYRSLICIYKHVFSFRAKAIYVVNATFLSTMAISVAKLIVHAKIIGRVHVSSNTDILRKHFPKEMLPTDYGGEERSLEELQNLVKIKLQQHQERFDKLDRLRIVG